MKINYYFSKKYLAEIFNKKLKQKKSKGLDKVSASNFEENLDNELDIISKKCLQSSYKFTPYLELLKTKNRNEKPRLISIPTIRDRLVLNVVKDVLYKYYPDAVSRSLPNSYLRTIKIALKVDKNLYFLKVDIKNYFDSIVHKKIFSKLEKVDNVTNQLVSDAIKNQTVPRNYKRNSKRSYFRRKGIPQGTPISNIIAQIYLMDFDHFFKDNDYISYLRYVDDILILFRATNKFVIWWYMKIIALRLLILGLRINQSKSQKGYMRNGIEYLGYKIIGGKVSVSDKNYQKLIHSLAGKFTWFKKGLENKSFRPKWLEDDSRYKDVFIEDLNQKITGAKSENKNYGWLFYFIELDDLSVLFKLDKIIESFFQKLEVFDFSKPKEVKKFSRSFFEIKFNKNSDYVVIFDSFDTILKKRNFLISRGKINPEINYTDLKIISEFDRYKSRTIQELEFDVGYNY